MLLEVRAQARGEAGAMQVNDARRGATLNIGGQYRDHGKLRGGEDLMPMIGLGRGLGRAQEDRQ